MYILELIFEKCFIYFLLFQPFVVVEEQRDPDPEFPTVKFPNPEEGKSALDLSIKTAEANGSTIILANDPDADRLACAVKNHKYVRKVAPTDDNKNFTVKIYFMSVVGKILVHKKLHVPILCSKILYATRGLKLLLTHVIATHTCQIKSNRTSTVNYYCMFGY